MPFEKIEIPGEDIRKGPPPPHKHFFLGGRADGIIAFLKERGIEVDRVVHFVKDNDADRYVIYYAAAGAEETAT